MGKSTRRRTSFWTESIILTRKTWQKPCFFYEYAASKGDEFLEAHNYSLEEIKDGLQQLAQDAGYGNIMNMLDIG